MNYYVIVDAGGTEYSKDEYLKLLNRKSELEILDMLAFD